MYLDLIKSLKRSDQVLIESKLTEEKDRCSKAIKLAEEGIKVALISSGESGFYGMAGLLLELLQNCLLYTSPSPRDGRISRMPSSA